MHNICMYVFFCGVRVLGVDVGVGAGVVLAADVALFDDIVGDVVGGVMGMMWKPSQMLLRKTSIP